MLVISKPVPRGIGRVSPLAPRPVPSYRHRCNAATGADQQPTVAPVVDAAAAPVPVAAPATTMPAEATAMYAPPPGAGYYQAMPPRQEYYTGAPPPGAYYPPPPSPYKEKEASSGAPWWIWLGVGVIAGQVLAKVQEFMKNPKTPQQIMMEMAMKQMSGAMGNSAPGGMPPFGGAASPFGGAAPGANPFANFAAAAAAANPSTVDTTAATVSGSASPSTASSNGSGDSRKGEKFASRLNSEGREPRKADPAPAAAAAAATAGAAASKPLDVVEPVVKEPTYGSGSSSSSSQSSPRSAFSFADVDTTASAASSSGPSSSGGAAGGQDSAVMSQMMEQMLRNPEMQKMLYPYLPEPMRNPQSIEWMLSNPEVKKQMEQMFAQQNVMSPQMMDMMKNMDFNQDKVNKQFAELGLKPEDVISKVMATPELAAGFSNPKVQAAILDITNNPMNIMKYQSEPEVMKVLEKVTEIFQPQVNK